MNQAAPLWRAAGSEAVPPGVRAQDRRLGEDGHPRKAKPGEDPHHNGLVLEWVYGSIVSTAEKARDGAKRTLGQYQPQVGPGETEGGGVLSCAAGGPW